MTDDLAVKIKNKDIEILDPNPDLIKQIDQQDRSEWTLDHYLMAIEDSGKLKFYSQWLIGKFAYEAQNKFPDILDVALAEKAKVEVGTLRNYRSIYKSFFECDPGYIPSGYAPWTAVRAAASTEDPVETLEYLEDNDGDSMKKVHRLIKEKENPNLPKLPTKPQINLTANPEIGKYDFWMKEDDFGAVNWVTDSGKQLLGYLLRVFQDGMDQGNN